MDTSGQDAFVKDREELSSSKVWKNVTLLKDAPALWMVKRTLKENKNVNPKKI